MKSAHPDDAATSGELLVVLSGASIELNALKTHLEKAGAKVHHLGSGGALEPSAGRALLVCDLASHGALGHAEHYYASLAEDVRPQLELIALGNPRSDLSEAETALLGRARQRYRRPLDVQSIAEDVLSMLREPRPSIRPQSQADRGGLGAMRPRSSQSPRISAPAPDASPSSQPSSSASGLGTEEPAVVRQSGAPAPEHSILSPELETLLAEAERRVQSQIALQTEAAGSGPPAAPTEHLSDDVWQALAEPLDDEHENLLPEAPAEEGAPPSPLERAAVEGGSTPEGDSTAPPQPWEDPLDEDTGSHVSLESELTSGTQNPITAAANSGAPPTLAPGQVREHGEHASSEVPDADRDLSLAQTPGPPSTAPPALRRAPETRPPRPADTAEELRQAPTEPPGAPGTEGNDRGTLLPPAAAPLREPEASEMASSLHRLELPSAVVRGAATQVLGRAVRQRFSGCLVFEVDQGLRRVVMKDGDVVIAASAVHGESLVAFLVQRGDVATEAAATIEHRIPLFGRHAGAALIARGVLEQGDLWPVLRGHAEWVLSRLLNIERGAVQVEYPVPERLAAEPAVFGGATGAEVLVEVVQRAISPASALAYLGDPSSRLVPSAAFKLLSECALSPRLTELVRRAEHVALSELLAEAPDEPMLPCVLYALTSLDVLTVKAPAPRAERRPRLERAAAPDELDDKALRAKILARRALVEEGDYFALLGVPRQATGYEIRRSYVELQRTFHPGHALRPSTLDLQGDLDTILEVLEEAYEILRDQARRERYRRAIESTP